mmetsp:Transcript_4538/g.11222  ORF Transcript_4538/g.11222 Transcript_4538/m.11222 type:complete len:263 (+) Transcript_4538:220-1008(+)|eukprot:CAMPEP_0177628444 /NCGR_PEP_ID=MMETSP0447-20121125/136_1 /TAXON_ID=0 /ORGANISM="Stygamoeba regulata, Strain BSH-02190019" /LENGTH=262 /DNA_ID=CAMNT_0019129695 /DNA_START=210 /DNA_END=998 /DNA_ORIENTATION=-
MRLTSLTTLLMLAIVACSLSVEVSAIGDKVSCTYLSPAMYSFDYSSVDRNAGNPWTAKDPSGNEYSWHICSEDQGLKGCTSSAVCQQPASGDAKSCGKLDTQKYSVVGEDNGETVSVLYNDGTQCQDGTPRQTTITLKCGKDPTQIVGSVAEDPANKCFYLITMQGKELCATGSTPPKGGSDNSLSGGSIFLIILACSIVLYLIVGVGVKFQKYEARGIDLIPNLDFWRDLPFLCKDGVMFVVDKVKGLFGGSSGTYETVDG